MKKFFSKFTDEGCSWIFAMFFFIPAVLIVIGLVFYIPIDYIKYKRSFYYKETNQKYSLFMGMNPNIILYNTVAKNNLPIQYVPATEESERQSGLFVYNNTLIIASCFDFSFDDEKEQWIYENEDAVFLTLDDYIELEISDANKLSGKTICDKAVVLIKEKQINRKYLELAKKDDRFMVCGKNFEQAIRSFFTS